MNFINNTLAKAINISQQFHITKLYISLTDLYSNSLLNIFLCKKDFIQLLNKP